MKTNIRLLRAVFLAAGICRLLPGLSGVWTLETPRPWARVSGTLAVKASAGGAFSFRHTGEEDWAIRGIPDVAVKPGEQYRLVCETEADGESRNLSTSVVLYDEKGEVADWHWGRVSFVPGTRNEHVFIVPPGSGKIQARLTGYGPSAARVKRFTLERTGKVYGKADLMRDRVLTSGALRVTVRGTDGMLAVEDRRTGRVWKPATVDGRLYAVLAPKEIPPPGHIRFTLLNRATCREIGVDVTLAPEEGELTVELSGEGELVRSFTYPEPFASRAGDRLIVPLNEGIGYPVEEEHTGLYRLSAYSGHGLCMPFFGMQEDATGAGWMVLLETPDDAGMMSARPGPDKFWTAGPVWDGQKKRFGYPRRARYVFLKEGGYVAMCKRYRRYAREKGLFKPFSEKVKERPNVDRLLGAANVWCWERDKLSVVSNLLAAGIDRILWSAGGTSEEVKAMAAMPQLLVSRYDIYQDVYHPEQLRKLGRTSGPNTSAWPHDVIWNSPSSNDWRHAWGVQAKDGTWTHCATMCDRLAPAYARRNIAKERAEKPYNTRFIDTTVAVPWLECWNPAHPMTRSDSRHWKMALLRLLGDEFGLVVGSETGHDASVPFCDYYEGMLSLGPYRVPDSGRKTAQIWTNVPPRVARYQLGEKYRLPLWELVYHDCVCAHWYWGDYNNKLPSLWWKRDLFNVLYGTMGMYYFNNGQWKRDRARFVKSFRMTSPVARATGYSEMLDHRVLSPDRAVQRTRFADGTEVTVNFGDTPFTLPDGTVLPARSPRVAIGRGGKTSGRASGLVNPVGKEESPDPFVTWDAKTGYYYLLFTNVKCIDIRRAKTVAGLRDAPALTVYRSSVSDGLHGNIWAPEMHKGPDGKWYIYTSGSYVPNDPWGEKRLFALESKTHDPFDGFVYRGQLDPSLWAIDPTVLTRPDGTRYMCYSRISRKGQVLVLREMKDPLTLGTRQAEIGRAELKWELVNQRINEGPYFIDSPDGRRLFLVYSGNGCWSDDYALGVIEFTGGDLFDPKNWKKHPRPVLYKGNGFFGPGHASFFRSPDGKELWCAYHTFLKTNPSCEYVPRYLSFQRVGFDETGYPVMGAAVGRTPQRCPSGE